MNTTLCKKISSHSFSLQLHMLSIIIIIIIMLIQGKRFALLLTRLGKPRVRKGITNNTNGHWRKMNNFFFIKRTIYRSSIKWKASFSKLVWSSGFKHTFLFYLSHHISVVNILTALKAGGFHGKCWNLSPARIWSKIDQRAIGVFASLMITS